MMFTYKTLKKWGFFFCAIATIQFAMVAPAQAQSAERYLKTIARNTTYMIQQFQLLLAYTSNFVAAPLMSLTAIDESDTTADNQIRFTVLGAVLFNEINGSGIDTLQITADLFNIPASDLSGNNPKVLATMPNININDLTYPTILGKAPVSKSPATPYNYFKNVSGANMFHVPPAGTWQGKAVDRKKYQTYYQTIMAVESFDSYMINNQYTHMLAMTKAQSDLVVQATDPNWFTEVASQNMGVVFRQLLLYVAESYVLSSRSLQLQQEMLAAQTMNNTLLILVNQNYEAGLLAKAQGAPMS